MDAVILNTDRLQAGGNAVNKIVPYQFAVIAGSTLQLAPNRLDLDVNNCNMRDWIQQQPSKDLKKTGSVMLASCKMDMLNPCFDIQSKDTMIGVIADHVV